MPPAKKLRPHPPQQSQRTATRSSDHRSWSRTTNVTMPSTVARSGERRPRSRGVSIFALVLCLAGVAAVVRILFGIRLKTAEPSLGRASEASLYGIDVIREYPHDPEAFTQGLLYAGNDILYESTGLYQKSSVRKVQLQTGEVLTNHLIDGSLFGEGLTLLGQKLYQVTWLTKTGFIYDQHDFNKRKSFTHEMQDGWGLATNGDMLYGSDGTSSLYHLDPQTLKVQKVVTVKYNNQEVRFLNELEYVDNEVWANVWQTDCIARISPEDGRVVGWILLHELRKSLWSSGSQHIDVLNGIAWDSKEKRLFVTGKLWPKLFEIKLRPLNQPLDTSFERLCIL